MAENISYVNKDGILDQRSIHITINDQPIVLSVGDCITFTSFENDELITAKINGFRNAGLTINSIFYNPWRENRWGSTQYEINIQGRAKGLMNPLSIIKLDNCPTVVDRLSFVPNFIKNRII